MVLTLPLVALRSAVLAAGVLVWACEGPAAPRNRSPVGPPARSRTVVVRFRSLFPGEMPCGTAALAGVSGFACAGDSLIVQDVPDAAPLVVEGPSLERYVEPVVLGDAVIAWLLELEHREVLEYVREIVNASGARPFPFGFEGAPVPVDLRGLDAVQAATARDAVRRVDSRLTPLLGAGYFLLDDAPSMRGVRALTTPLASGPARTFAETFDAAHKIVCRIELDSDLASGDGLSSRIVHELGHCLGLTRHDPDDRTDRIMNRLAPAEYWGAFHGLNEFDARVFALAVLASWNEVDLTNFR